MLEDSGEGIRWEFIKTPCGGDTSQLWDLTKASKNRVCAVNENILAVHKPTPGRAIQW
jgi:hypothetical protein